MKTYFLLLSILFTTLLYSQDIRYGKVSKEELEEIQHPTEPEADAAILYKSTDTYFKYDDSDGYTIYTEVFERIKIYNSNGFGWATKEIPLRKTTSYKEELRQEKAAVYNLENGKITSEKLRKNGKFREEASNYLEKEKLTLPNVKEGSVIEYSYLVVSKFFININKYDLQYSIPVNKIDVKFASP